MRSNQNRWLRRTAIFALAAFLPLATAGCFGDFRLLRKTYKFNQEVSPDKWVRWLVFLVITIVPVYGLAVVIDALFANSVEFWTGENPIMAGHPVTRTALGPNGELATATFRANGLVDLTVTERDGTVHALQFVREGDTLAARAPDGKLLARVVEVNGRPAIVEGSLQ